jgi:hypothetical protein
MSHQAIEARLSALEAEVRGLRDVEEIKALKAQYWRACDGDIVVGPSHNVEDIVGLYTEDGSFELMRLETPWGIQEQRGGTGSDALRAHFARLHEWYPFIMHFGMAPIIEVDGDRATGHWHFLATIHVTDQGGDSLWSGGTYEDVYVRTDAGWRIQSTLVVLGFRTSYDVGWHERKYTSLTPAPGTGPEA